jgi:hypothetical protein
MSTPLGERWTGLHPDRYVFGYIVVYRDPYGGPIYCGFHAWTRRGADRMAQRLNRRQVRQAAWRIEAGYGVERIGHWEALWMKDHPGRQKTS